MTNPTSKRILGVIKSCTVLAGLGLSIAFTSPMASAAEKVRFAMPTQSWWPTTIVTAAERLKLFEKEGINPEITIYKGGGPAFEALAADAADMTIDPPYLVALGLPKGINTKIVANGSVVFSGWHLMVPKDSPIQKVADLEGKKVGITANGSATDFLALWTINSQNVKFTRVAVGGGGLTPNLLTGNIDAAVVYSPVSFQLVKDGSARSLVNYGTAIEENLNAGWIATEAFIKAKPQAVQGSLNAIYGAVEYLMNNRDYAIGLIAELNSLPPEVAAMEYEESIMTVSKDGAITLEAVQNNLDYGERGGLTGLAPAKDTFVTQFKPVPTQQ